MNTPTNEDLSQHAYQLWQEAGSPEGRDVEFWLAAEKQLASNQSSSATTERLKAETAAESTTEFHISPAIPDDEAVKAALQKKDARAPKMPTKSAPKPVPAETGKPLYAKPHSS